MHPNTMPTVYLSNAPEEYHEFADIFSKKKADNLAPQWPYDLKIKIDDGTSPPPGSLSPAELDALRIYINENLNNGFIQP